MSSLQPKEEWHLDKRVPIAIITALLVQTFTLGWAVSSVFNRLEHAEVVVLSHDVRLMKLEESRSALGERFSAIETSAKATKEALDRIELKLDKVRVK